MRKLLFITTCIILVTNVFGQDNEGPTAEEIAKANNPLADLVAFNVQYYFRPELNEVEGGAAHTTWFRFAMPTGRVLWRVSAPLETRHVNNSTTNFSESGFGDLDIFAAYLVSTKPKFTFGIGPSASFNTASNGLGSGKNTLGLAAVAFAAPSPQIQVGGLVIWRTDVGGDENRDDVNLLALQPFYFWQLGQGLYFRGAPIIPFDLEDGDNYHIPMGLGIGKVVKMGGIVFNFFIEPQPSILLEGTGQPQFQIYGALNMQF